MATNTEMEMLAGKALYEAPFRRQLLQSPAEAAASVGVKLDDAQMAYIKQINPAAMEELAAHVQRTVPPPKMLMAWSG